MLSQARYGLLTAIGLDPNEPYDFADLDIQQLMKKYHLLTEKTVKKLSIDNDVQYQTDLITINGATKRGVMLAEDNARSSLNLNLEHTAFDTASLSLTIPIDDKQAKKSVASAKIALQQANINLKAARWNKEIAAVSNLKTVTASFTALRFAEDAEKLQEQTYHMSYQKYLHGLIDSLELQTAQFQLIQAQHALLSAKITYVKSLVALDALVGHTLKTWQIDTRLQ
jgi:hypothetical protein